MHRVSTSWTLLLALSKAQAFGEAGSSLDFERKQAWALLTGICCCLQTLLVGEMCQRDARHLGMWNMWVCPCFLWIPSLLTQLGHLVWSQWGWDQGLSTESITALASLFPFLITAYSLPWAVSVKVPPQFPCAEMMQGMHHSLNYMGTSQLLVSWYPCCQ